jgi:predicted Zn-dependent protease with MMP-like domain
VEGPVFFARHTLHGVFEVEAETLEDMVREALDALPAEFSARLNNLAIVVEDEPRRRDSAEARANGGLLLGLYRGVPLTARTSAYNLVPPDRIVVFQRALESLARDEDHLRLLVQHTVVHEVAHHFGISDARLRELGAY